MLSDKFLEPYKTKRPPFGPVGEFTYYRTYSRWLEDRGRREDWWETVRRVVEYNCSLDPAMAREEAEQLFDAMFHMEIFPAGRTLWIGGTKAVRQDGMANYNCCFTTIEKVDDYAEIFYALMLGCGVGVSVERKYVDFLPRCRNFHPIQIDEYEPVPAASRLETTEMAETPDSYLIVVGDSKEGWAEALRLLLTLLTSKKDKRVRLNMNSVRPRGERLRTFGGFASGPEPLVRLLRRTAEVLQADGGGWDPVAALDVFNLVEQAVVVGGVRRSSGIALGDEDDQSFITAKTNITAESTHRFLSNNSLVFHDKPSRERLLEIFQEIQVSGEPGFINAQAALRRRKDWRGLNPCGEVLLRSKGVCNLTEVVCPNAQDLEEAVKMCVRMGLRTTLVNFRMRDWDAVQKADRLLGVSLSGWQDYCAAKNLTQQQKIRLLRKLRKVAREEARRYAFELRVPEPLLVTTVKPSGTLSKVAGVSAGAHFNFAPHYIQRIRITTTDPLLAVMEDLGYPIHWEVNQDEKSGDTKVIEFVVKSPTPQNAEKYSAVEQLEEYGILVKHWSDHNVSFTCYFKPEEVGEIIDWLLKNWDDTVAVSFLPRAEHGYKLAPWEEITLKEYERRAAMQKPFDPELLRMHESGEDHDLETECAGGACPIR